MKAEKREKVITSLRRENKWLKEKIERIRNRNKKAEDEQFNTPKGSIGIVAASLGDVIKL